VILLSRYEALLGIDIGTGGCKATLMTTAGKVVATLSQEYPTHYPEPGWAEQSPEDWLEALRRVCRGIPAKEKRRIVGICVDGQPHTPVFTSEKNEILYPAIPWIDRRSSAQVERLKRILPESDMQHTFNPLTTTFTLPQILWMMEHQPQVWRKTHRLLVAKDFVRQRLIDGGWFTDPSDALGTYLFDGERFEWSESICAAARIEMEKLPDVAPSAQVMGEVTRGASRRIGLPEGVSVVNGAHDPSVENLAAGTVEPGTCFVKLATAGVISVTTRQPRPDPKGRTVTYCLPTTHESADGWFTKTATLSCGSSYRWFRDVFCSQETLQAEQSGKTAFELMDRLAAQAPPCSEGLIFHPYLIGEGSPYWDPRLKGSFFGATLRHRRSHFCRSVLEGVAFSIKDSTSVFEELNLAVSDIRLIGGGSNSRLWRTILCNVLGLRGLKTSGGDSSFGSAVLAGVGVGVFRDLRDGVQRCAKIVEEAKPDPELHSHYERLFQMYRETQGATASLSHELDAISERLPR